MAGLTVIYVDTLFLLNAIVDYLLLALAPPGWPGSG